MSIASSKYCDSFCFNGCLSTSLRTSRVQVKLRKRESIRSDTCLGEGSISIGDLYDHCRAGQGITGVFRKRTGTDCKVDYSLVLNSPQSRKSIGTLFIRLHIKAQMARLTPDVMGSRKMVETIRSKIVENLGVEYPSRSHSPSSSANAVASTSGFGELDGFEILHRVRNRLDSMNSGKLRAALKVIDAASQVCSDSGKQKNNGSIWGGDQGKDPEIARPRNTPGRSIRHSGNRWLYGWLGRGLQMENGKDRSAQY